MSLQSKNGSVFLTDVDDYLAPSQACVNPLFGGQTENHDTDNNKLPTNTVVPRKRARPVIGPRPSPRSSPPAPTSTVTASIADCLACSGCVTTAETVLLEEQHSLDKLRSTIDNPSIAVVATISPASLADLQRHIGTGTLRQVVTLLCRCLSLQALLDGNLPLQWTLEQAVDEFVRGYRAKHGDSMDADESDEGFVWQRDHLAPSVAVDRHRSQFAAPSGEIQTIVCEDHRRQRPGLPILASSCPALVCWVEKSLPPAVAHLSSVKSPMAAAAAVLPSNVFHLGIMPCHDKKLEASRKDLQDDRRHDVNIVVTTTECLNLVQERLARELGRDTDASTLRQYAQSLPEAPLATSLEAAAPSSWITTSTTESMGESGSLLGSGGYADFVFRSAARQLFAYHIDQVPWRPIQSKGARSARVANSRRRDYYEAMLYRHVNGEYSTEQAPGAEVVWRFGIAYGMQTMQRALNDFHNTSRPPFDYIEAMACPSGCVNGNGQLRTAHRETPSETRTRIAATLAHFVAPTGDAPPGPDARDLHTRHHIVAPLQHRLGAAKGVKVNDMQW